MKITAKVRCTSRVTHPGAEQVVVGFAPDYLSEDGKAINSEWAKYTPALSLSMNVLPSVGFSPGRAYTLTFDDGDGE